MKTCTYDDPRTMWRGDYEDGRLVWCVTAEALAQGCVPGASPFRPGTVRGDREALPGVVVPRDTPDRIGFYIANQAYDYIKRTGRAADCIFLTAGQLYGLAAEAESRYRLWPQLGGRDAFNGIPIEIIYPA